MTKSLENLLADCSTSSQAIAMLYEQRKQESSKFSLAEVCAKAGIPSRGYLVGVIKGRRTLNLKYRDSITKGLALQGTAAKFLKTLIDFDHEKDSRKLQLLQKRLTRYRKSLLYARPLLPGVLPNIPMAVEVFAAFGLFGNRAMEEDVVNYFGPKSARTVIKALDALLEFELIRVDGLYYRIVQENVMFSGSEDGLTHTAFLQQGMNQARKAIDTWFPRSDLSHFEASVLSVKRDQFMHWLPVLKSQMNETRSRLETNNADMLIHFAVQIFPLGKGTSDF